MLQPVLREGNVISLNSIILFFIIFNMKSKITKELPIKKITLLLNCLFRSDAILLPNVSKIKYSTKVTKFYFGAGLILVVRIVL